MAPGDMTVGFTPCSTCPGRAPRFGAEATARSRSIDLPITNVLTCAGGRDDVLRWYGKRAKLYAAFQRFMFQRVAPSGRKIPRQYPRTGESVRISHCSIRLLERYRYMGGRKPFREAH